MSFVIWLFGLALLYLWTARAVAVVDKMAFKVATTCIMRLENLSERMEEKRECLKELFSQHVQS